MDRSKIPYDTRLLGVPLGASILISKHRYVPYKSCTYLALRLALSPNTSNRASTWASSPKYQQALHRSTNMCFQNGFLDYGALDANHVSCTETNTIFKQTKARFHMTHVIKEFHRVHPNWFPSIWASSSKSTNRCVKNGFLDYGALGTNYAPILHQN